MNLPIRPCRFSYLILLAIASSFCAAQTYTVTDLGAPAGDNYSVGHGINASGQVAGSLGKGANSYVGLYSSSSWENLGTLGGGSAVAYALNDSGEVVGSAVTTDGSNHPFLYSNGTMTDLGTLGSPVGSSWWNSAQGINRAREVVGTSYTAQGGFLAFVWSNGKMRSLGTLGGQFSQGYAINNKGQTTGIAYLANGEAHAFLDTNGKMIDLGTLEGPDFASWGFGINDSGVVVGQTSVPSGYHAIVYSGGKMKDLNKLIPAGSGWLLEIAYGINNAGQIVGFGVRNGQEHGFLLTPQ